MPAAAVIPAPVAYIKIVAVKKLVVESLVGGICLTLWCWDVVLSCHLRVSICLALSCRTDNPRLLL